MTSKLQFKCSIGPVGCYQGSNLSVFLVHIIEQHPEAMRDHHLAQHDMNDPVPCACWEDGYNQGREDAAEEPRKPTF